MMRLLLLRRLLNHHVRHCRIKKQDAPGGSVSGHAWLQNIVRLHHFLSDADSPDTAVRGISENIYDDLAGILECSDFR